MSKGVKVMRHLAALIGALVLLFLVPVWVSAAMELTENELDEIGAAGTTSLLDVYLLANPSVRSVSYTSNGQTQVKVDGKEVPTSSSGQPVALHTKTTSLGGTQNGLDAALLQKNKSSVVGVNTTFAIPSSSGGGLGAPG